MNSFPKYSCPQPNCRDTFKVPITIGTSLLSITSKVWLSERCLEFRKDAKLNVAHPNMLLLFCFKVLQLIWNFILTAAKSISSKFAMSCSDICLKYIAKI